MDKRLFWYSLGNQTLAANTNSQPTIKISDDADFEITKIMYKSTSTFSVKFSFTNPSYLLSQNRIPNTAIAGLYASGVPNILRYPMIIKRNSVIECDILDTSGSSNVIDIILEGFKILN